MKFTDEEIETVRRAYSSGMTKTAIYRKHGIPPVKVMRIVAKFGIGQGVHVRPMRFPTRVDEGRKIAVKIDSRTTAFIRPGKDPEAVRARYLNHMQKERTGMGGLRV